MYALSFYSAGLFRGGFCEQIILTYYFWGCQFQSHTAKIFPKRFLIKNTLCNTRPVVVLRSIIASVYRIDRVSEHLFTAFTLKLSLFTRVQATSALLRESSTSLLFFAIRRKNKNLIHGNINREKYYSSRTYTREINSVID